MAPKVQVTYQPTSICRGFATLIRRMGHGVVATIMVDGQSAYGDDGQ